MIIKYSFPYGTGSYDSERGEYYCDTMTYNYEITTKQRDDALCNIVAENTKQKVESVKAIFDTLDIYDIITDGFENELEEYFYNDAWESYIEVTMKWVNMTYWKKK